MEALSRNDAAADSQLFVFCDGPKKESDVEACEATQKVVQAVRGFREVNIARAEANRGLAASIIAGVTRMLEAHGSVIVVEDDLISAPGFLAYMNEALERYREEPKVFTICGYSHPPSLLRIPEDYPYDAFFSYRNMSWGWGTWSDRWAKADWEVRDFSKFRDDAPAQALFNRGGPDMTRMLIDQMEGRMDSWAIRWSYAQFRHDALALLPVRSFIHNIGADSSGTHFKASSDKYDVDLSLARKVARWPEAPVVDQRIAQSFSNAYRKTWKHALRKAMRLAGLRGRA